MCPHERNTDLTDRKDGIAVLGAGSWGTALAVLLAGNNHSVRLWARSADTALRLAATRENPHFLPGIKVPEQVTVSHDLTEVVSGVSQIVIAVPSHAVREMCRRLRDVELHDCIITSATKGIESATLKRMSQVIEEEVPAEFNRTVAVLSGPNHAEEVSQGLPTATVVGSVDQEVSRQVQRTFMTATFRVYTRSDIIGIEMGGSLKNIIAVAAGICDGLGFGDNSKAGLITRGLAEITRLGLAMGAEPLTFSGLSGMGDLITTCISRHSRNRRLGLEIARGKTVEEFRASTRMVAEGINTTKAASQLARIHKVEMPITEKIYGVLFEGVDPYRAVSELMLRRARSEEERALV